jgi:1,4-dihydroxy-6-naphthoate synthase
MRKKKKKIRVAHSPDSDDAFMFYAMATRKFDTGDLSYHHTLSDIETLNKKALDGEFEVSAISFHAYAYMADQYAVLSSGGSMGSNYGPVLVSAKPLRCDRLGRKRIAIPGTLTTAFLALRLFSPDITYEVVPFDKILDELPNGEFDAGLLIHEGQLNYRDLGFHKVIDLGEWWHAETGLPLPLGGNVVRRDLGAPVMKQISEDIRASIKYGLDHRAEAMEYALEFARGLDAQRADRFVGMYVNELTLDYGVAGRAAIRRLLRDAHQAGLIPKPPRIEFI